ncbi:Protein of unknown function [Gryllus bimaculatus]|nr:Protein of unknown function [Gryllus bimaculatus]
MEGGKAGRRVEGWQSRTTGQGSSARRDGMTAVQGDRARWPGRAVREGVREGRQGREISQGGNIYSLISKRRATEVVQNTFSVLNKPNMIVQHLDYVYALCGLELLFESPESLLPQACFSGSSCPWVTSEQSPKVHDLGQASCFNHLNLKYCEQNVVDIIEVGNQSRAATLHFPPKYEVNWSCLGSLPAINSFHLMICFLKTVNEASMNVKFQLDSI